MSEIKNDCTEQVGNVDNTVPLKSWYGELTAKINNWLSPGILLDDTYAMAPTPAGMKRMLLDNQRTILQAVLDFEAHAVITNLDSLCPELRTYANSVIITEPPGSGKTIICIALVMMRISPAPRPIIDIGNNNSVSFHSYSSITRKFPPHRIFKCTVITVSCGVFNQWENEIRLFSNLRVLSIIDVKAFRKFHILVTTDIEQLNNYDIILIKNGKMTGFCSSDYVEPCNRNSTSVDLYSKFVESIRGIVVHRVIHDDIDMSKLPTITSKINSFVTINISATRKRYSTGSVRSCYDGITNPWHYTKYPTFGIGAVMNFAPYTGILSIRNSTEFISRSLQRVKINFHFHELVNPQANLFNMIGGMIGNNEANAIMEMLNGEAFDEATARLGVQATSVGDMFKRMLGNRFEERQLYNSTLDFITNLDLNVIVQMDEPPEEEVYHQKHFYAKKPVEYSYPQFETRMNLVWDKCEESLVETNVIIERFQQNICEGLCDICKSGLNEQSIVVMVCCGKPYHQKCAFATSNIRNRGGYVSCSCPHCKTGMDPRIAFVSITGMALEDIIDHDESIIEVDEVKSDDETEEKKTPLTATKLDVMIDIINGTNEFPGRPIEALYGSAGFIDKGNRDNRKAQTLIFTRFKESIKKIAERLTADNVEFRFLKGSTQQMFDIGEDFRNGKFRALVVSGEHQAAGRSFQYADRLIFMHKIRDDNIATQICGRIDRYGRTSNGSIHMLCYKNTEQMNVTYLE